MFVVSKVGSSISGAINYAASEGKNEDGTYKTLEPGATSRAEILGGFNFGFDVDSDARLDVARRLMEQNGRPDFQGEKDFYCAQDCLHVSLNWARGETPSREQKLEAARDYLAFQGMPDAMAAVIEHNDHAVDKFGNPHRQHIHIIASRVRPVGPPTVYPDHDRGLRDRGWAVEYEERMNRDEGWAIPQGSQWRHDQRAITRDQPDYGDMLDNLSNNQSVITRYRTDLALAFGGHYGRDADYHRDRFVDDNELIKLANYPHAETAHAYTTPEIYAQEGRIMGMATRLHAQTGFEVPDHVIEEVAERYHLDDEQKASVRHLTRDNGFAVQTGDAGTGKSHVTNKAVRDAYEAVGRDVVGGGFTNNVVLQMKQDGVLRANTLDYWKTRLGFEKADAPEPIIKPGSVFVFEEAGQVKNEHFEALYKELEKRGVKTIISGDPKQMASVERGAMMDVHIRQFGTSRLTQVYRHPEKQAEWDEMAKGVEAKGHDRKEEHWEKAIEGLRDRGEIHWFDTPAESIAGIADQWYKDRKERPEESQLILATTNAEVEQLNKAAIAKLNEHGERGAETIVETTRGPRAYAIGDRIVLRENHPDPKEKRKGFANGALGNLLGLDIEPDGRRRMTVDLDRPQGAQRRMFSFLAGMDKDAGEIDTDHGYAGTNYRGQGRTIDNVYPLHNPIASSPTNYVAMTRDKKRVFLAVARDETGGYEGLVGQMASGGKKRAAHSYWKLDEKCNTIEPERHTQQEETVATGRPRIAVLGTEFVPPSERPAAAAVGELYGDHQGKQDDLREQAKHYLWDRPQQRESVAQWRDHTQEGEAEERGRDVYRDWLPDVNSLFNSREQERWVEDQGGKPRLYRCHDCNESIADKKEDYMVKDEVWAQSGLGPNAGDGFLCLDDLEKRIGRKLNRDDFPRDENYGVNTSPDLDRSETFKDRLNRPPEEDMATEPQSAATPEEIVRAAPMEHIRDFYDQPDNMTQQPVDPVVGYRNDWPRNDRPTEATDAAAQDDIVRKVQDAVEKEAAYPGTYLTKEQKAAQDVDDRRSAVQGLFKAHRQEEGIINRVFNGPTPMQQQRMADEIEKETPQPGVLHDNDPRIPLTNEQEQERANNGLSRAQQKNLDEFTDAWREQSREESRAPTANQQEQSMPKEDSNDRWWRQYEQTSHDKEEKRRRAQQEPVKEDPSPGGPNKDTRTPQQIAQDEHGMTGKEIPDNSRERENMHRRRAEDYFRDEEPSVDAPRWKDGVEHDQEMNNWRPEAAPVKLREDPVREGIRTTNPSLDEETVGRVADDMARLGGYHTGPSGEESPSQRSEIDKAFFTPSAQTPGEASEQGHAQNNLIDQQWATKPGLMPPEQDQSEGQGY